MTITIQLPEGLDEALARQAEREAREAIGVRLYREEKLSHGQLQRFLGVSSYEADTVLKRHGGADDFSVAEIGRQVEDSQLLRQGRIG
jgi:predicted HTH domain antitoxin